MHADIDHNYWGRAHEQPVGGKYPRPTYKWTRSMAASDMLGTVRHAVPAVRFGGTAWAAVRARSRGACAVRQCALPLPPPSAAQVAAALASAAVLVRPLNTTAADRYLFHAESLYWWGDAVHGEGRRRRQRATLGAGGGVPSRCPTPAALC